MSNRLRIVCPFCIICLALLVFSLFLLDSADSGRVLAAEQEETHTYQEGALSADHFTEAKIAGEIAAEDEVEDSVEESNDPVPEKVEEHDPLQDEKYNLTSDERKLVECIVMCEAGGEGVKGQMMVAQSIRDGMARYDLTVSEYLDVYSVAMTDYCNVTNEVSNSVFRVFDRGERVTEQHTDLWYNPTLVQSSWHEEQQYVTTVGSHRFFYMIDPSETRSVK